MQVGRERPGGWRLEHGRVRRMEENGAGKTENWRGISESEEIGGLRKIKRKIKVLL